MFKMNILGAFIVKENHSSVSKELDYHIQQSSIFQLTMLSN